MDTRQAKSDMRKRLRGAQRRRFTQGAVRTGLWSGVALLSLSAVAVAIDQRWGAGDWSLRIVAMAGGVWVFAILLGGLWRMGTLLRSARALDEMAGLKDRILSAQEFLQAGVMDEPRRIQVMDALQHAKALNLASLFETRRSRTVVLLPALALLLVASFFIPPHPGETVEASVDHARQFQMEQIAALEKAFEERVEDDPALEEALNQLREIEQRLSNGEMEERDVLIALSRLDEQLQSQMTRMDIAQMSAELETVMPHLMASTASRPVGEALKQKEMDKAAEELDKLAEKMEKGELSEDEKGQLANNMGVAASKLGSNKEGSLGGDFESASESMKGSDAKGFERAANSMGDKFRQVGRFDKLSAMRKQLSMCKAELGQLKECSACSGVGCGTCNGTGLGNGNGQGDGGAKGGLKAGTAATGSPFGDGKRLADSYREMVQVSGMAGEGAVDSEVEQTEGQLADSQVAVQELFAEYEAAAEQAIEQEAIPLSHRFHVKRYFQSIRPEE